jgi:ATP-dependent Clp protease ATP-binding subunit ClpC
MFERFTDRARRAVVLAQEEARLLDHNYIGTEHILLGLLSEGEGIAAQALRSLGIDLDRVRHEVEEIIGRGTSSSVGPNIPFTPRSKKVLELSLRESMLLDHDYIGTEHILLGLVREGEGVAAQVLVKLGAKLDRVRAKVLELLAGGVSESPTRRPASGGAVSEALVELMERARRQAEVAGETAVGPVHLFRAAAEDPELRRLMIEASRGEEPTGEPTREPTDESDDQPGDESDNQPGDESG